MSTLHIKSARLIDPANHQDVVTDIVIEAGVISAIGTIPDEVQAEQHGDDEHHPCQAEGECRPATSGRGGKEQRRDEWHYGP